MDIFIKKANGEELNGLVSNSSIKPGVFICI